MSFSRLESQTKSVYIADSKKKMTHFFRIGLNMRVFKNINLKSNLRELLTSFNFHYAISYERIVSIWKVICLHLSAEGLVHSYSLGSNNWFSMHYFLQ